MPHLCPRPCSRLATAAVFISVGVVQFIVGVILLRSKYVYLLAGPDFWTSLCNIAVGCLLGLSASVWKQSRKRRSNKQVTRRNLLLALLFSALIMNATTLGIFLLGEGNALLSIRLESGGRNNYSTFASEVLASAYVTSVCCPIVCIVVTIVSMAGSFFKYTAKNKFQIYGKVLSPLETQTPVNDVDSSEKERSQSLRWVFAPELLDFSKKKVRELILSSSSESFSDEDSDISVHPKYSNSVEDISVLNKMVQGKHNVVPDASMHRKYSNSTENIQHVFSRMAQGKRDSILSDSAIMLRQMELRRKNRYNSNGSYMGPPLPHEREPVLSERHPKDHSIRYEYSTHVRSGKSKRVDSDFNGNARSSPGVTTKRYNYSKSKLDKLYKNPYTSEELLKEYQNAASKLAQHYPSQYKKFRERLRTRSEVDGPASSFTSEVIDQIPKDIASIHKKSAKISQIETEQKDLYSEYRDQKKRESVKFQENEDKRHETSNETASPNDIFSPDGSELGSMFDTSLAGELVPINIKHSSAARLPRKLIPVASPVVPGMLQAHVEPKLSVDSGICTSEQNSFNEVANHVDFKERKNNLSSFREDLKGRNKEILPEYPKIGSQSIKKYDLNRVATMASISEEPNLELNQPQEIFAKPYESEDKTAVKTWKGHSRNKSLSCVQPGTSRETGYCGDSSGNITPKRKRSASGKALRKIWSLAASENQIDFLDQVVDKDSLIGLSEEELIARQLRTRSIRKAVQQRMKEVTA